MIFDKAVTYAAVVLLTLVAPYWSLLLFVLISPWNIWSDTLGWDPRLGWSLLLALRATITTRTVAAQPLPRFAIWSTLCFVLVSLVRLRIGTREIPAVELDSANEVLLYFIGGACASFSILRLTDSKHKLVKLLSATALSLLTAAATGLLQATSLYGTGQPTDRISGTLGNPNYFAVYLSLGATVTVVCWRVNIGSRVLAIVSTIIAVVTCILTFSRAGTVICFLGLILAMQIRTTGKVFNCRLLVSLAVMLTLAVGLTVGYLNGMRRTLTYSADPNQETVATLLQESGDLARFESATFALEQWLGQPLWGVGLATLAARNYSANGLYVTTHDTYAQVLAGTGIIGAGLIASAIVSLIRSVSNQLRRYMIPGGATLGLCFFFVDCLQSIEMFVLFGVLVAMLWTIDERNIVSH
jgi:hypothetical protein